MFRTNVKLIAQSGQSLVLVVPVALLAAAAVLDGVFLATQLPIWYLAAFWLMAVGVVTGIPLIASWAVSRFVKPEANATGTNRHVPALAYSAILVLFALSLTLRVAPPVTPGHLPASGILPLLLSMVGFGVILATGWFVTRQFVLPVAEEVEAGAVVAEEEWMDQPAERSHEAKREEVGNHMVTH
jgi:hypothetical protein